MKKGILLLSALLLIGVSACDFCGKKNEETKTVTEQAPVAEAVPVEVAMNEDVQTEKSTEGVEGATEEVATEEVATEEVK